MPCTLVDYRGLKNKALRENGLGRKIGFNLEKN
jgi:hypothetical protein